LPCKLVASILCVDKPMSVASSRRRKARLLAAVILFIPMAGFAQEPTKVPPWRLLYTLDPSVTARCPAWSYIHTAVAAEIGYDPFVEDAPRSISLVLMQTPERLEAHIEAHGENGELVDKQTAWAPSWRCDMLIDRAAVFLVDIVDPAVPRAVEEQPASTPSSTVESAPPVPTTPAPLTVHVTPTRKEGQPSPWIPKLSVFAGGGPTFWPLPEIALSLAISVEARWPRLSLGIQGRYDLAWSLSTKQEAHGNLAGGAAHICGHHGFGASRAYLRGCVIGGIGRLTTSVDGLAVKDGEASVVDVGARLGTGYWFAGSFGVELQVDALYLAHRPAVQVDQAEVWRLPAANIAIRAGVVGLFDVLGRGKNR